MGKHTSRMWLGWASSLLAFVFNIHLYIENPYNSYWREKRKLIKNIWRRKCVLSTLGLSGIFLFNICTPDKLTTDVRRISVTENRAFASKFAIT